MQNKIVKFAPFALKAFTLLTLLSPALLPANSHAEEGGSGHYLPGSMSSFVDTVPPSETFIARFNFINYRGDFDKQLPIAALRTSAVEADSQALGLTLLWRPPVDLGESWSYAMSATIPYVIIDVDANVEAIGPSGSVISRQKSDSEDGLGDVVLMPLMFNYKQSDSLNFNARLAIYAPTGEYEVGRLANTGKNFWTYEPTVGAAYFGKENGIEATLFAGMDFNTENTDTDYKSGEQAHLDGTLAQHFPLVGGLAGVGVSSYWYQQIDGDSGAGANFGSFKGRTVGVGPAVSYVSKVGETDLMAELKWLNEVDTERRIDGDYIWFKLLAKF